MFSHHQDSKRRAKKAVRALSDYPSNKTHDRHFDAEECKAFGLEIKDLESDPALQDLVLTVHHCYMLLLMNYPAFKIIENHKGVAFVKNAPAFCNRFPSWSEGRTPHLGIATLFAKRKRIFRRWADWWIGVIISQWRNWIRRITAFEGMSKELEAHHKGVSAGKTLFSIEEAQIAEVRRRDAADTGEIFSNDEAFAKLDSFRPRGRNPSK